MPRDERGFTLLEIMVVCALLGVVLAIVSNFLISANRTVAVSTANLEANGQAQDVFNLLDDNLRYSTALSIGGGTASGSTTAGTEVISGGTSLYAVNSTGSSQPACAEWALSGTHLTEFTTGESQAGTVATGITAISFSANQAYQGLVTVQLTITPSDSISPPVTVTESVSAENLPTPTTVAAGVTGPSVATTAVCTP